MGEHKRIVTGQRGAEGALVRPCPKCHAPIGHQCRPLRAGRYAGDRKTVVHKERREARRG